MSPRPANGNQDLVLRLSSALKSWDFNAREIAAGVISLPTALQKRMAEVVFHLVGFWAEQHERHKHNPAHPMNTEYAVASRMLDSLMRPNGETPKQKLDSRPNP